MKYNRWKAKSTIRPHAQSNQSKRIYKDFNVRPEKDRELFAQITWCDSCYKADLGMFNAKEFEQNGKSYIEGECTRCGSVVLSEIINKDILGVTEECIWPIHHPSRPALTRLPSYPFINMTWNLFSRYGYYPLKRSNPPSLYSKIIVGILGLLLLIGAIKIVLTTLKFG